jgi:hypothetical protein
VQARYSGTDAVRNGLPAPHARAGNQEALAARDGDMAWVLFASGPGSHALLESLLPGISTSKR